MKIRARMIAVGLLVPAAIVTAVGTSTAATQPPARQFKAHYQGSFALVTPRVPAIGSVKPIPVVPARDRAAAQQLRLSGQGWAMTLGQSELSGMVTVGQGSLCRPITGWAALSTTRSPLVGIGASVRVWLSGVMCKPQEGSAIAISGRYREEGLAGGGGSFAGRAYGAGAGRLVLYFKGSI